MKRFYQQATITKKEAHYLVLLDGKTVHTPRKHPLCLPNARVAEAIAEEWQMQSAEIRPHTMPLTQMANGVMDLTEDGTLLLMKHMVAYVGGDMLYFREESNPDLFARQQAEWEPWLRWAERRYDVRFIRNDGLVPAPQPPETMKRLSDVLARLSKPHLIPLNILATGFGSLILGLAVCEEALEVKEAFQISILEQRMQMERWGMDDEQASKNAELEYELQAAARFLALHTRS